MPVQLAEVANGFQMMSILAPRDSDGVFEVKKTDLALSSSQGQFPQFRQSVLAVFVIQFWEILKR